MSLACQILWSGGRDVAVAVRPRALGDLLWLGSLIETIGETDDYTLASMSKKLGVSPANLCDIEKGRKGVSLDIRQAMRNLLNLICVMACLAGGACSNDAPAPVEPTPAVEPRPAVERPPVATAEASAAKNDDAKSASCNELRAQLDAQKSFRVLATLDGSLDDQAALDAAHNAVQAELPAGSATDLRVMGVTLAAVVERPALEALCASTRVVMVRKPRIAKLD